MNNYQNTLNSLENLLQESIENKNVSLAAATVSSIGTLIRSAGHNTPIENKKSLIKKVEEFRELLNFK